MKLDSKAAKGLMEKFRGAYTYIIKVPGKMVQSAVATETEETNTAAKRNWGHHGGKPQEAKGQRGQRQTANLCEDKKQNTGSVNHVSVPWDITD